MSKIIVSSDSTCDLSQELVERYGIKIVPLLVVSGSDSYKDGIDITPADVFRLTEETGKLCSTSAVNVYDYSRYFSDFLKDADELIHICISSDFSTCYNNACMAAEEFGGRVVVIDSRNLSTGQGHVVIEAALAVQRGEKLHDIEKMLNELTGRVEASFVVDKLDYLKQGGRCSAVKAFGAAVLQLKPSINVIDGKMTVGQTYRGTFEKCLRRYVKERLEGRDDIVYDRVFITYSSAPEGIPEMVEELVREYADFKEIIHTTAGCTVSCHCGPNTLGVLFIRSK